MSIYKSKIFLNFFYSWDSLIHIELRSNEMLLDVQRSEHTNDYSFSKTTTVTQFIATLFLYKTITPPYKPYKAHIEAFTLTRLVIHIIYKTSL